MPPIIRGNSLYQVVAGPRWTEAEANANRLGGNLVSIGSREEDLFLQSQFGTREYFYPTNTPGSDLWDISFYWIGFTDSVREEDWRWSSGEPVGYTNWGSGLPNNQGSQGWPNHDYVLVGYVLGGRSPLPQSGYWDDFPNYARDAGWSTTSDAYKGIAEIPIRLSVSFSSTPTEGAGIFETSVNLSTASGLNLPDGSQIFWKVSGVSSDDLIVGSLSGALQLWGSPGFKLQHSLLADADEGESFEISLFTDPAYRYQIGTTRSVRVNEAPSPVYAVTPSSASVSEGSSLTTTVRTSNLPSGTNLYWSISGAGISVSDFTSGGILGSGTIGNDGSFVINHVLANDFSTEGLENFTIRLYSDSSRTREVASSSPISIVDTSTTPAASYSLSPSSASLSEGSSLFTTARTTNVSAGTTLYWGISGTGISSTDFSFGSLSGSSSVGSDGSFQINHIIANDFSTEGWENFTIRLYSDSSRTREVASTAPIWIGDTSTTPTPTYFLSAPSSIDEGAYLSMTAATTGLTAGTPLYYQFSGSGITGTDVSSGLLGATSVGPDGKSLFDHLVLNDLTTEGDETLIIKLFSDSTRTKEVASTSVLIKDTSKTPPSYFSNSVFSIADLEIAEGASGNDLLTINRSGDTSAAQTVAIASRDGSAKAGSDYEAISTSVNFAPGVTTQRVRVRSLDDTVYEGDESFSIVGGAITGGPSTLRSSWSKDTGTVTIKDNDPLVVPNRPASGNPTIDGKVIRDAVITANTSGISDADGLGSFSYRWSLKDAKGSWIELGTAKELKLTNDMVNKALKLNVSFTDGKGNLESLTSAEVTVRGVDPDILKTMTASDWEMYVDRYPLTLGTIWKNQINPSTGQSKAAFGESHYLANGDREGRVLKAALGSDLNDYGAYVENYGTTLLDVYRSGTAATNPYGDKRSLFEWGKWHYDNFGKAEGRQIAGGVDWGAIVRNDSTLLSQFTDAQRIKPSLTAFQWGYDNQSSIKGALGIAIGTDLADTLSAQRTFGLGGDDTLIGTTANDILHGGFGNDAITGGGGKDLVYGGPGDDVFQLAPGSNLSIRDFRKGADLIQLTGGLSKAGVTMEEDFGSGIPSAVFVETSSGKTLGSVYGMRPGDLTYALVSKGVSSVWV